MVKSAQSYMPPNELTQPWQPDVLRILGRYPSVISDTVFDSEGMALVNGRRRVPVYLANGLGFNAPGRLALDRKIQPIIRRAGGLVFDPFVACGEFLDPKVFDKSLSVEESERLWSNFHEVVIPTVNYGTLIPRSKLLVAICEGAIQDDGMAAEMAYAHDRGIPVVGVRTDIREAERFTPVNPAVKWFASGEHAAGSKFLIGPQAYERLEEHLKIHFDRLLGSHQNGQQPIQGRLFRNMKDIH